MSTAAKSTSISHAAYSPGRRALLIIWVNSGAYLYKNVPPALGQLVQTDPSGSFVNANIKGFFEYEKVNLAELAAIALGIESQPYPKADFTLNR